MMLRFVYALLLGVVFVGLTGAPVLENLLLGIAFGAIIGLLRRAEGRPFAVTFRSLVWSPVLVLGIVIELVRGSWRTTRSFLSRREPRLGYVYVGVQGRSASGTAFSGLVVTASPGSTVVDLDPSTGSMLLQVVDTSHAEKIRDEHRRFYARYQEAVVP